MCIRPLLHGIHAAAGLVYWDVLKAAKLDSLRVAKATSALDSSGSAGKSAGSAKVGRVTYATNTASKLPASYTQNNTKESRVLAYASDFKRVFEQLYPFRCAARPICERPPQHAARANMHVHICPLSTSVSAIGRAALVWTRFHTTISSGCIHGLADGHSS